jgi:hypothetical protein
MENHRALTPEQILSCGVLHLVHGIELAVIAEAFHVNQGRVSEAVTVMRYATEHPKDVYRVAIERPAIEVVKVAQ